MKRMLITILLITLIGHLNSFGQENSKSFNLVVTIDDNVAIGSMCRLRLIVRDVNDNQKVFEVGYIPGELTINKDNLKEILSDKVNKIILAFDNYEYCNEKQIIHNYEIEIYKNWFQLSFIVLRIYNLDKKKYSKIFYPLEGRDYTYELVFPTNSILRIKKIGSKNNCE